MVRTKNCLILFLYLFLITSSYSAQEPYKIDDVIKIKKIIKKIKLSKEQNKIKKEIASESEVNSYLNFRLEEERIKSLKEIKIKIFKNNILEGKILIDFKEYSDEDNSTLNLYFRGKIIVKENFAKIDFEKLFIEEQAIPINFLEFVVNYLSRKEGYEPLSIFKWYELPYGIKDIRTETGKIIIYY